MPTSESDPAAGDPVILRGRIRKIDGDVAMVEVYRSYPTGITVAVGTVAVQCAALERDESGGDGGAVPSDEEKIREAMAEAQDHPGRIVTR